MVIEEQRLEQLERRVRRVERELGLREVVSAPSVPPPAPRPAAPPIAPPVLRPVPPPRQADLEQLLGGRVLAWVGGAAVVAGLALLLALGISRGWIGEGARTLMAGDCRSQCSPPAPGCRSAAARPRLRVQSRRPGSAGCS